MPEPVLDFRVRRVLLEDFDSWRRLWDGYNEFYGRVGPDALPEATTLKTWERFFDSREAVYAIVADCGDQLVGIAHYVFHRSTTRLNEVCYLNDLFSIEKVRGRGVGRRLIETVYAHAQNAGCESVYWQTHETNSQAMALYDKLAKRSGFVVYSKILSQV
ncbi:MAG: GNAT family N-acetyltransferase [Acidobacteria bacterium ACB1]|nr:hypothetical protein [Pyrinomonadaceae bacterium]MCE7963607.1 GNAT family N-acetyltransferase [Acidobacteria bacterium ACB1]RIJ94113.1 MAG: GNAT family N-acetyltransferase [Acidobacteriota bacterium]